MAAAPKAVSPQETEARAHLRELEYPRLVSWSSGYQTPVANVTEAEAALKAGAFLVPVAPSRHDGGVPNHDHVTKVQVPDAVSKTVVLGEILDGSVPTLVSLVPATAVLGSPNFTLEVRGTGFVDKSVIVFAGQDEPTTVVNKTKVTTGVNMAVWLGPDPAIPVQVRNPDGVVSNTLTFAFTR
jgi:hypothetical protein